MSTRSIRWMVSTLVLFAFTAPSFAAPPPEYPTVPPGKTRSEKALKAGKMSYWADRPDQAQVLSASFLGGKGTEWLTDGGFQPDGTVVLCGNVFGSVFEMPVKVKVIGTDNTPTATPELAKDKKGVPEKPSWRHSGVSGYIALVSPDLKTVLSVSRLPWGSASITAGKIAKDGSIYIAGKATDTIAKLGGELKSLTVSPEVTRKGGSCDFTFVAKITPDASKCLWIRTTKGMSDAPKLTLLADGNIKYGAQDLRTFDPTGKEIGTPVVVPGGVSENTSVNPVNGTFVKGGEHNSPTGREPWRCPTLNTYLPDGSMQYQLYDWRGPYVVLDNCRQVSDTAVKIVTHDQNGNVLLSLWSDGGNSVAVTQPNDVRRGVGFSGLGINAAGAGVLSAAYLVRLESTNYTCTGWTIWLAFFNNKPNGVWIRTLGLTDDSSICFAGGSAWGLRQTSNKLANGEPSGEFVAVLTPDMSGCRFSSVVPGAGFAEVGNNGDTWGIASGTINGKTRVLFLSGASSESEAYGLTTETATQNALQSKFGGGLCDGYFIVLDLPKLPPAAATATVKQSVNRLSIDREARGGKPKTPPVMPAEGTLYTFEPDYVRWNTVDAEIRDALDAYWPNFLYGKPASGSLTYSASGLKVENLVVECPNICQPQGDQRRRVLGELAKDPNRPIKLTFTLTSLGPVKTDEKKSVDSKGKEAIRTVEFCEGKASLDISGRKVNVTPNVAVRYGKVVEKNLDKVMLSAYFTVKGRELGLTGSQAESDIDFRVSFQGWPASSAPAKKKK